MAEKRSREVIYREQLKSLGIYDQAFEPEIKQLAELERRRTRARKAWSDTVPKGSKEKPSFADPSYQVLAQIERELLVHRDALGLTPKALRRLRGSSPAGANALDLLSQGLDRLQERVGQYTRIRAVPSLDTNDDA